MAYEIVPYTPALAAPVAQLQTHLWSTDEACNAAYLAWKYVDNPFLDEVLIRVALCDGAAVAMRGLFGAVWEADAAGARALLPYADDFVVAPAHRNRGVANRVMAAVLEAGAARGLPFAVSLSAGAVIFVSSLASGWRAAGSYRSVWRDVQPTRWSRRLDRLRQAFGPRGVFDRLDRAAESSTPPVRIARQPQPQPMADLIGRLPWDGRIRHVRDAAYLAWRFRNPLHEYRFVFWEDGGLQGYLVLQRYRFARADAQRVNIVDWEAADERVRAGLLRAALASGQFARVYTWTVGAGEPVLGLLREHGFAAAPDAHGVRGHSGLLVRSLGPARAPEPWTLGGRNLLEIADWDLRMLYSMVG